MASELKESKEVVTAICYVGLKTIQAYKQAKADGKIDLSDVGVAFSLLMDPALKEKIEAAIEGSKLIGDEVKTAKLVDVLKAMLELQPELDKLFDEAKSL